MAHYARPEDAETKLHQLLLKTVPKNEHGNKTISHLAALVPCTRATVFNWINNERLSPERAARLVEIGKMDVPEGEPGRVSLDDFHEFVYPS